MISIIVSEAYAFDYLSILYVKDENFVGDFIHRQQIINCIQSWVGAHGYCKIMESPEFKVLMESNRAVWRLVGKASKDECKASEVDAANQLRYAAKKALQERFWPSKPLAEMKSLRPGDLPSIAHKPTVPIVGGG